jgi:hypothetical protein
LSTHFQELDMSMTHSRGERLALVTTIGAAVLLLSAATSTAHPSRFKGGPWMSIEAPVNPYDADARGASFVVHTFHHAEPTTIALEGRAEGLVDGQRRTVPLALRAAREGTFPVRNSWGTRGTWSVVLIATQPESRVSIQGVVDIGADGSVGRVSMPKRMLTTAEIDRALRARAGATTRVSGR